MTAATSQELKGYQSQLAKAKADAEVLKSAVSDAQRKYTLAVNQVKGLEDKIAALQESTVEPIVSEHAMLRWLERVNGLNLEAVRNVILDDGTSALIKFTKNGRIKKDGHTLVIKNNTVVTVE